MGVLYDNSLAAFIIVTLLLAGGAAWLTGRALARAWAPIPVLIFYMLLLGLPTRFFHWSLAEGTLLSLQFYITDVLILLTIALLSYRLARTSQMVTQYPWLYRRTGPLSWAPIKPEP